MGLEIFNSRGVINFIRNPDKNPPGPYPCVPPSSFQPETAKSPWERQGTDFFSMDDAGDTINIRRHCLPLMDFKQSHGMTEGDVLRNQQRNWVGLAVWVDGSPADGLPLKIQANGHTPFIKTANSQRSIKAPSS